MSLYEDDDGPPSGRLDLGLWRRLLRHAVPYKRDMVAMVGTGLLVAAGDTMLPMLTGMLIDGASDGAQSATLVRIGTLYALALAVIAVCIYVFIDRAGRISTGVAHDLRRASFAQLQCLSYGFFDRHATGWLVARLTSDCGKVSGLLPWLLLDWVWGTSLLFGIAVAMFWLDARLAVVVLTIVPPLVLISFVFQRWMLESSRLVRRSNAVLTASFTEAIAGVRTTKALAREAGNLGEFQVESRAMHGHAMRNALQSAVYLPGVMSLGSIGVGLALWQGGVQVQAETGLTLGTLVAFMQYATLFSMPIQEMARQFTLLQSAQAAAERVQGLLEAVPAIRSPAEPTPVPVGPVERVCFDAVNFAYVEGAEPVTRDLDLVIEAGQTVALVGPTGGGKSTLVKLLARFYDVSSGSIRVGGTDIRDFDVRSWQAQLGFVLQDPHLFKASVADNILYGRLDATDEQVRDAARQVCAHGFITALSGGYDTDVGEAGSKLSTGQRQLVAMARAVLADPAIFVLDEATSSVDTETEQAIQAGIEAALEGRIAFVIAHRLSTIESADRIVVVADGRIVEQGDHHSLMAHRGQYWQLRQLNSAA